MKITFVLPIYPGNLKGGFGVVYEYANHLQKGGHHVRVVYPTVSFAVLKRLSFGGFMLGILRSAMRYIQNTFREGHPLPSETSPTLIRTPILHPRFAGSIERSIPDADVIVATSWETAYVVNRLSDHKGQKFYFIQHYEIWDVWNNIECWKEAKRLKGGDEAYGLAMARVVPKKRDLKESKHAVDRSFSLPLRKITISEWLRHLIEDEFGERIDGVIPNGVNFDIFFRESNHRDEPGQINVLMPYRPMAWKGFDDGLDAFERIRAHHPNTHFAVFGGRPSVNIGRLRNLPEWIEFHDGKSDEQLRVLYNDTHIFVFPSWIEGFGLPSMEAMACGCAVVTTDAGGFSDYLKNGETALIVPIQNPAALAQSVCKLIEDDGERRRVAENGYRFVKQFTWEKSTQRLIEFVSR